MAQSQTLYFKIKSCSEKKIKTYDCACVSHQDELNICKFFDDEKLYELNKYGKKKQKRCIKNIENLSCEDINKFDTIDEILENGIDSCFDFKRKTKKSVCKENYKEYCRSINYVCSGYMELCEQLKDENKLEEYCSLASDEFIQEKDYFSCPYLEDNVKKVCENIPDNFIFDFRGDSWKNELPEECFKKPKKTKQDMCYENYEEYCEMNAIRCSKEMLKGPCKEIIDYDEKRGFHKVKSYELYKYCADMENPNMEANKDDKFVCRNLATLTVKNCYYPDRFVFDFRSESWKEEFPSEECSTLKDSKHDACFRNYNEYLMYKQNVAKCENLEEFSEFTYKNKYNNYNIDETKLYYYCSKMENANEEAKDDDFVRCLDKLTCSDYVDFRNDSWKENPLLSCEPVD